MKMLHLLKKSYYILKLKIMLIVRSRMKLNKAEEILNNFYPKDFPNFSQNNNINRICDLMIIVPVYNVECYLEECILSLLNQKTKYDYQIVFVNDGSTDSSFSILKLYKNDSRIKIINQSNKGLSAARNRALEEITGKYVMFVDSDDYLANDAVEKLLNMAYKNDADVVESEIICFANNVITQTISHGKSGRLENSNELFGFACGKVIRAEKLKNFCFPENFKFEDTVMGTLLHPTCARVYGLEENLYYYRQNPEGITATSKKSRSCVDTFYLTKYCLKESVQRRGAPSYDEYRRYLKKCRLNYIRTIDAPDDVKESIFILTSQLFEEFFGGYSLKNNVAVDDRIYLLEKVIRKRSYKAFVWLMDCWDFI